MGKDENKTKQITIENGFNKFIGNSDETHKLIHHTQTLTLTHTHKDTPKPSSFHSLTFLV